MSFANITKQKKMVILIIVVILIIMSTIIVVMASKDKKHTFKSEENTFTVRIPKEWTVIDEYRNAGGKDFEPSPDEGIRLLLNGSEDNFIRIYSQYGSINFDHNNYVEEAFSTNEGIKGVLYTDKESLMNLCLVLDQDVVQGNYGVTVSFKDKKKFDEKKQQILNILKSIEINKP